MELDSVKQTMESALAWSAAGRDSGESRGPRAAGLRRRLEEVNRELWLVLSLFVLAGLSNLLLDGHHMVLGLYSLPTLFSAYIYGRRHATLTALASLFLVVLVTYFNPALFRRSNVSLGGYDKWFEIMVWGGILMITAYTMGTLYEKKEAHVRELRRTYHGILIILSQFISKDKYTQNHSYRVSVYGARIAAQLGLSPDRVEDVRAAALLHDLGKLEVSRDILHKASRLTANESEQMRKHVDYGIDMLEPVGGSLSRLIPIILAHHDKFDGTGYHPTQGEKIPLEARILSVADVYDSLTSDRPYRKAMSPFDAKETIMKGAGSDFDPQVVEAFVAAFRKGQMEVPEVLV
ncbi:MAG TPA: HD-GYP domain-containing protein [Terriglobales bacterium]|nr:HD-GYP domain-containing protein [Terriglobales bacterium]